MAHKCISPFGLGVRAQAPAAKRSKVKLVSHALVVTHAFVFVFLFHETSMTHNSQVVFFTFCVRPRVPVVAAVRRQTRE